MQRARFDAANIAGPTTNPLSQPEAIQILSFHSQWHPTAPPYVMLPAKVHFPTSPLPRLANIGFADVPTILHLVQELADYENASSSVEATEESLLKTLSHADSSDPSKFSQGFAKTLLLTDADGTVAGMALYFYNYSTWTGGPGIYLEDLFVKPAYRNKGYGKLLLKELAKEVLKVNGKRLEWSCLDWNEPSLQFYQSEAIGAKKKSEWVGLRVEGDALGKLAGS